MTDTAEPTVEDSDLRAELIAFQLETAIEAERQRQRDAKERERLATKVAELEERNSALTMAEAARLAGLDLDSQPAKFFMHFYDGPPDPETILRRFCLEVLGKPIPEAHRRRLQRLTTRT